MNVSGDNSGSDRGKRGDMLRWHPDDDDDDDNDDMLRGILKMRRKRNTSVSKATSRGLKLISTF